MIEVKIEELERLAKLALKYTEFEEKICNLVSDENNDLIVLGEAVMVEFDLW